MLDTLGRYEIKRLPWNSSAAADIMEAGRKRHHVAGLVELDVTLARERLGSLREETGERVSFTGWLAYCTARALAEHPELNVARYGSWRKVVFRDVDVVIIVERVTGGERRPLPFVLRRANEKSVVEISREIRAAQGEALSAEDMVVPGTERPHWLARLPGVTALYPLLPAPVRGLFWKWISRDAFAAKRMMGTVGITAVGMFGRRPAWPLSTGVHTIDLAVGSIARKPGVVDERIVPRDVLALTIYIDHDLVDGAPAARFVARLGEMVEQAAGLGAATR